MKKLQFKFSGKPIIISSLGLVIAILYYSFLFGKLSRHLNSFELYHCMFVIIPIIFASLGTLSGFKTINRENEPENTFAVLGVIVGFLAFLITLYTFFMIVAGFIYT